jgi:DHA3 family macrolide efflux protein-like MFS transporter
MLMFKALKNPAIRLLWGGQALSAIGDEIYRVAFLWLSVSVIGADTGYLAASQYASLLLLSLFAGKWADHWNRFKTMFWVDALRAIIVLIPVILFHFMPLSLVTLLFVAVAVSALSAFFDPALQAILPLFSPDYQTLQAANAIMGTTLRLARVIGPGIIAVMTLFLPTIHFFTFDSLTFVASALTLLALRRRAPPEATQTTKKLHVSFREALLSGVYAARRHRSVGYITVMKAVCGGAWALAYSLGLALRVHELAPDDVRAFGWVIAAYGIGNLGSTLVIGNWERRKPASLLYFGHLWMGLGFILMGMCQDLHSLMAATLFSAMGGPLNDIPFTDIIQAKYPLAEVPKLFRLRMASETAAVLLAMLVSPTLFRWISVQATIVGCGIVLIFFGMLGFYRYTDEGEENPLLHTL